MGTTQRPRAPRAGAALLAGLLAGLLVLSLAACSGGAGDSAGDEARESATPSPTTSPTAPQGPVEHRLLRVISTTLGGGVVDARAVDLTEPGGVDELVAGLESGLPAQVRRAVRQAAVDADARLYGAVVWVGCEIPEDVEVVRRGAHLEVGAVVPKRRVECLAPVTSVALFTA